MAQSRMHVHVRITLCQLLLKLVAHRSVMAEKGHKVLLVLLL
jgi:hypothetical protein